MLSVWYVNCLNFKYSMTMDTTFYIFILFRFCRFIVGLCPNKSAYWTAQLHESAQCRALPVHYMVTWLSVEILATFHLWERVEPHIINSTMITDSMYNIYCPDIYRFYNKGSGKMFFCIFFNYRFYSISNNLLEVINEWYNYTPSSYLGSKMLSVIITRNFTLSGVSGEGLPLILMM